MSRQLRWCFTVTLLALLAACGGGDVSTGGLWACEEPVTLDHGGAVRGRGDATTCSWLGIPYAEAPSGARRFRRPTPHPGWSGVRAATTPGPVCPQEYAALDVVELPPFGDEDCLYLNLWRPRIRATDPLPVMVFIHGGAFTVGAGSWPQYDGRFLAEHGVVVVTINYRLGPFGFLALPELEAEDPEGSFGNWGLWDQVEALRWVQRNVAAFGGDPQRVTIFGESAGGMSVCSLLAAPVAAGLFQRAIIESGGCTAVGTRERGFAAGEAFVAAAGCADADDRLACLRSPSAIELLRRVYVDAIAQGWHPHVDGVLLPEVPITRLRAGTASPVPLIAGANGDEVLAAVRLMPTLQAWADASWDHFWTRVATIYGPDDTAELRRLYGPPAEPDPARAWGAMQSDRMLRCPTRDAALAHRSRAGTWHYDFRFADFRLGEDVGTFHGEELAFVFGAFEAWDGLLGMDWGRLKRLAAIVQGYWSRFAATGAPDGGRDAPPWPPFADGWTLILGEAPYAERDPLAERCAFWGPRTPLGLDQLTGDLDALGAP